MLKAKAKLGIAAAALLLASAPAFAVGSPKLTGTIAGIVRDPAGIPQMGATVLLFNKSEKLLQRALTNERGAFGFESLTPDLYSVRVSLASFMPALKQRIAVQPGMQSLLYINLANMLSSVELVYAAPGQGALMSDDWKWTLKTATATRPILRFDPRAVGHSQTQDPRRTLSSIFSDTRGLVKVSAGDANSLSASSDQQDLGTAFALATSLFGHNQLQVSGNVGYGMHSAPTAGFRTTYRREGLTPEISVTMRQVSLPTRAGMPDATQDGLPALRTMSVGIMDRVAITGKLQMEYGAALDSISFVDHQNYYSPFGRLTYDLGNKGTLQFAYSSGAPPTELAARPSLAGASSDTREDGQGLSGNLATLALLPRVSLRDERVQVQRTQNFEMGYQKVIGSRTVDVSAYHEIVSNGAFTMMAPDGLFIPGDVLPDISSDSSIVNVGSYQRNGYAASVTQTLGDKLEVSGSFGNTGVLTANEENIETPSAGELRSNIRAGQRFWGSARASATLPATATRITTTYEWTDYSALMPSHYYVTQKAYPEPGLNIHVRQPIPAFPGLPGRLEATVDLRNLMAQGYLPLSVAGRRVLMMQNPRALRGGLSFIF